MYRRRGTPEPAQSARRSRRSAVIPLGDDEERQPPLPVGEIMRRAWEGSRPPRSKLCVRGPAALTLWTSLWLWGATPALALEPLYTNTPRFRIPFQFDREEMTRIGAVEVQLHVSRDRGGSWSLSESVSPAAQRFTFDAPQDGEYWFAVRTIDLRGQAHPDGPLQTGLIVVVDREPPTLSLTVSDVGGGEFEARWQAVDEHLDLSSLRIETLEAASGVWQPLLGAPAASGSSRWLPQLRTGTVQVRGSVSDLAGNATSAEANAAPQRPAPKELQQERPDWREPIASAPTPAPPALTAATPAAANTPVILPNMPHAPVPATPVLETTWPLRDAPTTSLLTPPGSGTNAAAASPVANASSQAATSLTTAGPVRRVNARTFRIGYEVNNVGPSGVGSVDLYITEDGGQKWFHYGSDPDRQSPFEVVVPRDGQYGFSLRVRNGLGIVADPPQPNEPPEFVILVDQTPPVARLLPPQQIAQGGLYQVRIGWFAQDDCLAERPIALSQSANVEGPWEPISGWIENTGRFDWTVSSLTPRRVYLRLEVRDAAGNVTSSVTDQPLLIDTTPPTARILEVETAGSALLPR